MSQDWHNIDELIRFFSLRGQEDFAEHIRRVCAERLNQPTNGDLKRWAAALDELPLPKSANPDGPQLDLTDGVRVVGNASCDLDSVRDVLMKFHPWRKGPLEFLGIHINTEWRSDWKWERVREAVDLQGKTVLDVGCGNGYYGWRMIDAGARLVLGMDPTLRFVMQFEAFRRYAPIPEKHFVVPMIDTDLPEKLEAFDVVFSMGVLYHRTSPIDHLRSLAGALRPGGTLVIETLIVETDEPSVLVPTDRYAQMRNVWFLPSVEMLNRWLLRTGFEDLKTIDVSVTSIDEQRSTDWMTFQSLKDFLDPNDATKTIEGYPAPVRAIITATRGK